jgi:hypothetical protein
VKTARNEWQGRVVAIVIAWGLIVPGLFSPCIAGTSDNNPGIAPFQSSPYGKPHSEWAAHWWQWVLATPADVNPVGGADCSGGQEGNVWFLFGSFDNAAVVKRECTVPSGTALFFPLINAAYFAFLNDEPETRTEEFLRAQVNCSVASVLEATIDGVPVRNPFQYFEESPLFDVQLPEDNIFGYTPEQVPELLFSPSVDQGYYLFLWPLPPGEHEIHWEAAWTCPFGGFTIDATYSLTVRPGHN